MTRYEILIGCERCYQLISPDGCRDPINDCKQPQTGIIDLDHMPTVAEIDRLNEINHITACTQTGCKRFLGSTVMTPRPPYDEKSGIKLILE